MATKITDSEMTSDHTRHIARTNGNGGWVVTWLPSHILTRNQAITAMTIAEVVSTHEWTIDSNDRIWLHVDRWAAELGISGPHAVAEASLGPEDHVVMA